MDFEYALFFPLATLLPMDFDLRFLKGGGSMEIEAKLDGTPDTQRSLKT